MALTDRDLAELLADLESDRVERKETVKQDKDKLSQAICAFANDLPDHRKPGVLFVGVTDNGTVSGLPVTDELPLALAVSW
ncbi:helix-turn-helix domain-containing protein [Actinophytocola sp.]|uniref:AlbA family DNA-binding domain-containing protein n=1 Tax=Actinophytocola sp. TaxID=1872138 RepID=UPI0025BCFAED|nr:ATP-binding protein [Actinophytocola sp.]